MCKYLLTFLQNYYKIVLEDKKYANIKTKRGFQDFRCNS